jgi:acyl dehydratase
MPIDGYSLSSIQQFVGRELGVSDWLTIDQDRIDGFAAYTDDRQWIHVDVKRARRESPFGLPIAHGYLILALLPRFFYEVGVIPPDVRQAINYGAERVRFVAPVRAGSRRPSVATMPSSAARSAATTSAISGY